MRDIQIEEDLTFEKHTWVVQRVGWVATLLAVVAAALGFLGSSALSRRTAEAEGIKVEYERLSRERAPTQLMLTVTPPFPGDSQLGVWVAGDFFQNVGIEKITPEPVRTSAAGDTLLFVFALDRSEAPLKVKVNYKPEGYGRLQARVGVSGSHQRIHFRSFVYP
ncbi:MAG: hypothetical protein EHM61_23410 [Acidobacteria bacterium]|nr:MAG: hypothetical protein EHM61_23410 [Acidobacteriota bacterium]